MEKTVYHCEPYFDDEPSFDEPYPDDSNEAIDEIGEEEEPKP